MKAICVFAGSNSGVHPHYRNAAVELGAYMAQHDYKLIYGGSKMGLMGEVANEMLKHGGHVVGIMPKGLFSGEIVHTALTELIEVSSMHERKATMHDLSDGYIALPGGFGTFEELFEALCWAQIGIHKKPVGLLNVNGYYNALMSMVEHAVTEGFSQESAIQLINISSSPQSLISSMMNFTPPSTRYTKWNNTSS
ncbi:TIGR00730 family Rossman fold protein [Priestia flexa]|uniref:Cytokinin riboside 5'-monophosphate phosphoribohydrolase n=1 Tax=Priestia flexa TaxID=86664 RepID=A0A8I1MFS2_9BACI|nr:TIGR00730 family Rossman fold protein [Priestia flexa]MBN8251605.1 TIGR00730 family Rossman fold protein [Priestia flexa]MBN8436069.1 TIGR00730 family Rossman fold protein [Priestia flexa]MCA0968635.1 TIGR00730 family Rossman fold protein [Priestia flexa]RIV11884.1 TIGR00730 family Rossman fold protein [Priestia flexa]UIR31492.1 TIGR00730 family Rossman fold protein [Priestia flexa]